MRNRIVGIFTQVIRAITFLILLLGLWVFVDWRWPSSHSWTFLSTFSSMSGYSGLCLILSALALGSQLSRPQIPALSWVARLLSLALVLIAILNLISVHSPDAHPFGAVDQYNRASLMTSATSINFILLSLSLFFLSFSSRRFLAVGQGFAMIVALISVMALTDYLYAERSSTHFSSFTAMALPTAFVVFVFSMATIFASPSAGLVDLLLRDSLGGRLTRRLLPLILATELAIEWFRFRYAGPSLGEGPVLIQWLAIGNPLILLLIATGTGWYLDELDKSRLSAWEELRKLNGDLESRILERTSSLEKINLQFLQEITERKFLEKEISEIRENIQERLGRVVHDGLSQELTGIALSLKAIQRRLGTTHPAESVELGHTIKVLSDTLVHTKNLARQIYPAELAADGIMESLHDLVTNANQRFGENCVFLCEEPIRIGNKSLETHLFYIAQEALENALRHSHASKIVMELTQNHEGLSLSVRDNGVGIEDQPSGNGIGMRILKYRAKAAHARLTIESNKKSGTRVHCLIPRQEA